MSMLDGMGSGRVHEAIGRREFLVGALVVALDGPGLFLRLMGQEGGGMYGLIGRIRSVNGARAELVGVLLEGVGAMPGCLSYVVAADPGDPDAVWVTEVWEGEEAHAASLSLPAVRTAIARGRPLIAGFDQRVVTAPVGGHGLATGGGGPVLRSTVAPVADRVIALEARLSRPPSEAFRYFTEAGLLTGWLAHEANVEAQVGGPYELFWDPSDRENDSTIGCRVTAVSPDRFIAFQWRSPRQFKALANAADPLTHVVVMFTPDGPGTRVHLVHSGWRSGPEWEEARQWQERAWRAALQKLERG